MSMLLVGLAALFQSNEVQAQTTLATHENGCVHLSKAIPAINTALNEALLDEAMALADQTADSISCQPDPVSSLALTAVFHMKGAVHTFRGEEQAAREAFAWAVSVSPLATLDEILGSKAQQTFQEVQAELLERPGGILQLNGESKVWIDGRVVPTNTLIELPSGNHLLQWQNPGEPIQGKPIEVTPGETRTLPVGIQAPPLEDAAALPDPALLAKKRWLYLGSGGTLVVTGSLLLNQGLAKRENILDGDFETPEDLDEMAVSANALGGMGMGTAALGVALMGIGFVTTTPTVSFGGSF
ncbi:MAG: hypothetical protein VX519_04695 [Myxococcota bacterium]|nr:hypothetical protein [Myxococcota bacterium]